jgi:hypothetical protein
MTGGKGNVGTLGTSGAFFGGEPSPQSDGGDGFDPEPGGALQGTFGVGIGVLLGGGDEG